jgi:hypothetical protein
MFSIHRTSPSRLTEAAGSQSYIVDSIASRRTIAPGTDARGITMDTLPDNSTTVPKGSYGEGRAKPPGAVSAGAMDTKIQKARNRGRELEQAARNNAQNFYGNSSTKGGSAHGETLGNPLKPGSHTNAYERSTAEHGRRTAKQSGYTTGQLVLAGFVSIILYSIFK